MSSTVKILIAMAMSAVAGGTAAIGIETVLTDAEGNKQSATTLVDAFPSPAADGTFTVEVDFTSVASGAFTGSVVANDATGNPVAPAVSFGGTATNLQPIPVSVNVAYA